MQFATILLLVLAPLLAMGSPTNPDELGFPLEKRCVKAGGACEVGKRMCCNKDCVLECISRDFTYKCFVRSLPFPSDFFYYAGSVANGTTLR